ncbi:MAG: transporter substrate-binding domain-containing protein [Clostridia bacterium]|nr:transporter substrate-binding domain-containing protein [Clostridia bacterium]
MFKSRKILSILLFVVILACVLTGCNGEEKKSFHSMEDFEHAKIGVLTGSSFDLLAKEHFPESEKYFYMNISDLILNLKQEKIDGILMDMGFFAPLMWEGESLICIDMDMPETEYGVAFPKSENSETLKNQINEFIQKSTENGFLSELKGKWLSSSQPEMSIDFSQLTGENGTLRLATTVESKPFAFIKDGEFCGFDAEFIYNFAKEYGYALEIDTMDFGALLPSITAGRYDMALSGITVTEERKESVLFSDIYCTSKIVMAAIDNDGCITSLADLKEGTVGIISGTNWDIVAQKNFPNAERKYFTSTADALLALEQGKIDAFFADKTVYAGVRWENDSISDIKEPVENISNALILAKDGYDENLLAQLNSFIAKSKNDGTLDTLSNKWFGDKEPSEHPDYTKLNGTSGTLKIAIGDAMKPTAYQKGSMYTGYEVEFLTLFAKEYGYKLEFHGMAFDSLIPSVSSGKCDIGAAGITITPERTESVTFTDSHFITYGVAVVKSSSETKDKVTFEDLRYSTIGVLTGTVYDTYTKELFPEAKRQYYTIMSDIVLAMSQGKIDCYMAETTYVTAARWEGLKIDVLDEIVDQTNAGFIFNKDGSTSTIREQLNDFIVKARNNGLLDELNAKWFGETEPTEFFDKSTLTGENGTLKVAIAPDLKPVGYIKNGEAVGYDVEVLFHFALEYGYNIEFYTMSFDAVLPGVSSGRYDIGSGAITITDERSESVDFSESYLTVDIVIAVSSDEDLHHGSNFFATAWNKIKASFDKTFVRESRWKLILQGVGVTMLISISAAVVGSFVGFGLYLLSRSDVAIVQKMAKGFAKGYSRIIAGTPVVVILMILFYVIFGKIRDMSGIVVAIIGFTLTFGAFVYDHMTVSVNSVDRGQTEAAYALGYTKNQTFFRIIFPQAMTIFLPSYCAQAVELIKATAVVGYIAVNDLTKMGDIIRSNTYEAFFPLIATAVIYFLLTWGLSLLLGLIKLKFEPKRRSKEEILKGVKTK